jgi:hypothetical protein
MKIRQLPDSDLRAIATCGTGETKVVVELVSHLLHHE